MVKLQHGITTIGSYTFLHCTNIVSFYFPTTLTTINNSSFQGCKSLQSLTIPKSVISIGQIPFGFCESLTNVIVDEGNTKYKSIDGVLFGISSISPEQLYLIQYPPGKESTTYTLSNDVVKLNNYCFFASIAPLFTRMFLAVSVG